MRRMHRRFEFSDVYIARPGDHPRDQYDYALAVSLTNVGGGPARRLMWKFEDEDGPWTTEMVDRPALLPGERTEDWAGIRHEDDQSVDPTEDEALAFYRRCILFAI